MSLVQVKETTVNGNKQVEAVMLRTSVNERGETSNELADYAPTDEERGVIAMVLKHFVLGTTTMYTPRVEFNDLSLTQRDQYDQMAFNTYQPNNGDAWQGAPQLAWRSRALRPIVRNKIMSIAAHATARLIFPKVFAFNDQSDEQKDAAQVMEDLMEWSGDISNYPYTAFLRVITALSSPASIGYTEYGEVTRSVKVERNPDGTWQEKRIRDEAYPCFMDSVVPVDQLYIQNIFEPDLQKQGWLIWRKVYAFSEAESKYNGIYENFKYVRPGVQTIYDDANRTFYYVYDPNMRQENVEEIMYWNKNLDLKLILVNGVLLTSHDNPNPRQDKLFPFDKFGYELIHNRFFYYKDLAFKLQQDANVVNTLYQMVIDGTYLSIFRPMVNVGGEIIASDVIVPGAVTTLSDPNADLRAINVGADLRDGLVTLSTVEKSINESSQEPLQQGGDQPGTNTAYEISQLEKNANTVLGLFIQMISKHVQDFGRLRLGDILQYLTIPEVVQIEGADDAELVYKTFFIAGDTGNNKKIMFDKNVEDEYTEDEYLDESYKLLGEEKDKDMTITRVNPELYRNLKYKVTISPDILNPRSEELERAFALELYDRAVQNPVANQDEIYKLLLQTDPKTKQEPDKYMKQEPPAGMMPMLGQGPGMPQAGNGPLASMGGKSPISSPMAGTPMPALGM